MGLILLMGIQVVFIALKIIDPKLVVNVAQTEWIVIMGTYIDSHLWASIMFTAVTSFIVEYLYCCACCQKKFLRIKEICVVLTGILISRLVSYLAPTYFVAVDVCVLILMPVMIMAMNKETHIYSLTTTFIIHNISQVTSLAIRDVSTIVTYPNSATYLVLLIDSYIWLALLYCYNNYRRR